MKFTYKEQREYETIDEDIAKLEEKLASIERQITANATNSVKLRELMGKAGKLCDRTGRKRGTVDVFK